MPDQQDLQSMRTALPHEQLLGAVTQQTAMLRTVLERLDQLVQLLAPKPSDGPTLDELLAGLVTLISDQTVLLKRIDARTAVLVEPHLHSLAAPMNGNAGLKGTADRG